MQPDADGKLSPALPRGGLDAVDLVRDLRRGLAPGQIFVDVIDGDVDSGIRRTAEIERRAWRLHRLEQQAAVLDADVHAAEIHGLAGEKIALDAQELARERITR